MEKLTVAQLAKEFHIYPERGISQSREQERNTVSYTEQYESISHPPAASQTIHYALKFHAVFSLQNFLRKYCSTSRISHSCYMPRPSHPFYKLRIF